MVLPDATPGGWLLLGGDDAGFHDVVSDVVIQELALGRVLRTGGTELIRVALGPTAEDSLAEVIPHPRLVAEAATLHPADVLSVALRARGVVFGALVLVRGQGRGFASADVELAQRVSTRAAAGLDGARHYEQRAHMASALQRNLRPPVLPVISSVASAPALPSAPAAEYAALAVTVVHRTASVDLASADPEVCVPISEIGSGAGGRSVLLVIVHPTRRRPRAMTSHGPGTR